MFASQVQFKKYLWCLSELLYKAVDHSVTTLVEALFDVSNAVTTAVWDGTHQTNK
jgi:hypothetical protein